MKFHTEVSSYGGCFSGNFCNPQANLGNLSEEDAFLCDFLSGIMFVYNVMKFSNKELFSPKQLNFWRFSALIFRPSSWTNVTHSVPLVANRLTMFSPFVRFSCNLPVPCSKHLESIKFGLHVYSCAGVYAAMKSWRH